MTISDAIKYYKDNFSKYWEEEKYKWLAVQHFNNNWDIDADDFAEMLRISFNLAENLLVGNMYYAYPMLCDLARNDAEKMRILFRILYNEDLPLTERYKQFRAGCKEIKESLRQSSQSPEKINNHYQDLRAITVYLSFKYPEKYFLYKSNMYNTFKKHIDFQETSQENNSTIRKYDNYARMCEGVIAAINADNELQTMQSKAIASEPDCYKDSAYHLLAQTIIYVCSEPGEQPHPTESTKQSGRSKYLNEKKELTSMIPKNTILYGPPGTGKTYNSAIYAVAIIEGKDLEQVKAEPYTDIMNRYNEYKKQGQIEFTTFHQSYGYEEFIEGIRPVMEGDSEDTGDVKYRITSGLFKSFCDKASPKSADLGLNANPTIWKVSLAGTGDNPIRTECMQNGHIRVGFDESGADITGETEIKEGKTILNALIYRMQIGDIVLSCYSSTTIDAIGVVTGEYEWHDEYEHFKRVRKVNWIVKGVKEDITRINAGKTLSLPTVYALNSIMLDDVMAMIEKLAPDTTMAEDKRQNYVFIVDEINRGNISKIFGELITLIEPSKRIGQPEGMMAKLPYSQKDFGVPDNVYLIGTMNTADRSVASLDTALRRRFRFKEMQPDPSVLEDVFVEGLSIGEMLRSMNRKISVLYDREHTIGHAYFIPLKNDPSIENLSSIFSYNIIPLLQEYFYEDYEKIRLVLGDNKKDREEIQFITVKTNDFDNLFGDSSVDIDTNMSFEINKEALTNIDSYKFI